MVDKKRRGILDTDLGLDKPFAGLAKEVAPNERALTGELGDEMLDVALGRPHVKRIKGPQKQTKKGLLDL